MKKFLVLYRSKMRAGDQMTSLTPEQAKAGMAAWMAWAERAGAAVVDLGSPIGDPHYFSGSPAASAHTHIGGFSILQAEDEGALRIVLNGHPHTQIPGNSIEAHEFLTLPGM
jgi:hypothetical protein